MFPCFLLSGCSQLVPHPGSPGLQQRGPQQPSLPAEALMVHRAISQTVSHLILPRAWGDSCLSILYMMGHPESRTSCPRVEESRRSDSSEYLLGYETACAIGRHQLQVQETKLQLIQAEGRKKGVSFSSIPRNSDRDLGIARWFDDVRAGVSLTSLSPPHCKTAADPQSIVSAFKARRENREGPCPCKYLPFY